MSESAATNSKRGNPSKALVFSSCCSVPVEPPVPSHPHVRVRRMYGYYPVVTCACANLCLVQQVPSWFPPSRELDAAPVAAQQRTKYVPKQRRYEQRQLATSIRSLFPLSSPRPCFNCSSLRRSSANRHRQATFDRMEALEKCSEAAKFAGQSALGRKWGRDGRMYMCTSYCTYSPLQHGQNDVVVWSQDEAYPKQVKDGENGKSRREFEARRRAAEKDGDLRFAGGVFRGLVCGSGSGIDWFMGLDCRRTMAMAMAINGTNRCRSRLELSVVMTELNLAEAKGENHSARIKRLHLPALPWG
ncbi:hypothetical protein V8C40DRAFT_248320 [Trichoderma camerunense]